MKTTGVIALVAALSASASASPSNNKFVYRANSKTPAVTVRGNAFFAGDTRFYIRGVDYQPGGSSKLEDPLANPENCKRDIGKFQELGINTVRIYTVDNTANHDECMQELSDAGIYLALDVNTPKYSLRRDKPARSYNEVYLQNIYATMDIFQKYDNTLLFFSGNEVINDNATSNTAPYIKAVTRDMKSYLAARNYRKIPIGYSAADVEENREETANYMNCGTDDERSDFFAFNDYSWCDPSDFQTSGWDKKVETYKDYSIPIFLSEYGCNTNTREFNEVAALYSDQMTSVYSGGLVYEYSQEPSNYGLVEINGGEVSELPDFQTLKEKFAAAQPPQGDGGYKQNGAPAQCPAQSPSWDVTDDALPAMPEKASDFLDNGAGTGAGLQGEGSQEAGPETHPTATAGSGQGGAATGGGSSSTGNTAASLHMGELGFAPFACTTFVLVSTLLGAALV